MKISKILLAGLLAAGLAASASAQTEVYIAGSTAYRGGVTKAIQDVLIQSGTFQEAWDGGSGGKGIYGAGEAVFSGTYNGTATVVHTYWTGSVAGCVDISVPNNITKWLADTVTMAPVVAASGTLPYTGGVNIYNTGYATVTAAPNVAMSDSFFSSVGKSLATEVRNPLVSASAGTVFQADINNAGLTQAGTLGEAVAGVLPFEWVAGAQTVGTAPFNNMTQEAATQLIQSGRVSVSTLVTSTSSVLTGDTNDYAFLIGRNEDSGTRICAQGEAQVGSNVGLQPFGNVMKQYYLTYSGTFSTDGNFAGTPAPLYGGTNAIEVGGTAATVTDFGLWPANAPLNTEPNINWDSLGHSGQIGGGDVATVLEAQNPLILSGTTITTGGNPDNWIVGTSKAYFVGYIGLADAAGIPGTAGTVVLTYNGVPYSPAALWNGSYDFWSFEHMYYRTSGSNQIGSGKGFADALCDEVYTLDCQTDSSGNTDPSTTNPSVKSGGLLFSPAKFSRSQEGAPITPLF